MKTIQDVNEYDLLSAEELLELFRFDKEPEKLVEFNVERFEADIANHQRQLKSLF